MKVNFDVTVPKTTSERYIDEQEHINNFLTRSSKTMSLGYDTTKEASSRAISIRNWLKKRNINIKCVQRMDTVYLIKEV